MITISEALLKSADIAEYGDKPLLASLLRCAAAQLIAGDRENALLLSESKRLESENDKLRESIGIVRSRAQELRFDCDKALAKNGPVVMKGKGE